MVWYTVFCCEFRDARALPENGDNERLNDQSARAFFTHRREGAFLRRLRFVIDFPFPTAETVS